MQQALYRDRLIQFINLFRAGKANGYGVQEIAFGLLKDLSDSTDWHKYAPPGMVAMDEKLLTEAGKLKIVKQVLRETGFAASEYGPLCDKALAAVDAQKEKGRDEQAHLSKDTKST